MGGNPAAADPVAEFYRAKTVTIIAELRAAFWKAFNDKDGRAATDKRHMRYDPVRWEVRQKTLAEITGNEAAHHRPDPQVDRVDQLAPPASRT